MASPNASRRTILRAFIAGALFAATITTVLAEPASGADPADHTVVGVIGCSNTHQHAGGYEDVSVEDKLWPQSAITRYGGGTLSAWTSDRSNRYFQIFDTTLATYGADAVWVQLCIREASSSETGMTAHQQSDVIELIDRIHTRDPALPIYISPLNAFAEGDCPAVGPYGQLNAAELADWAAEEGLALRGPDTGPLDHSQLRGDLCHPTAAGEAVIGQQLVDFFDNDPPQVMITAPADGSSVSATVTIGAEVTDDYGVTQVDFFVDDVPLATDTEPPYEADWDTLADYDAAHSLRAVATDDVGKVGEHTITVTVDNGNVNTPPMALIADDGSDGLAATLGLPLVLDGSASFDGEGTIVAYDWDFGDGETASGGSVVSHTYAAGGNYVAALTVTDDGGLSATDTVSVVVSATDPPQVTITAPLEAAVVSGTVTITADASDDIGVEHVTFAIDGHALSTDPAPPYEATWESTLVYDGAHEITATVLDGAGLSATDTVTITSDNGNVNTPPAALIADDGSGGLAGIAGVEIHFDGAASLDDEGSIVAYDWVFDDGAVATGSVVDHAYAAAGVYTATLTVTDDGGLTGSVSVTVTVAEDQPPIVEVTNPIAGPVAGAVTIEATATDDVGVAMVELLVDGVLLDTDLAPPYAFDWDTTTVYDGAHTVTAVASDGIGQTAEQSVIVEVANGTINTAPTAAIASDNGTITALAGAPVTLDGSQSTDQEGTIESYEWDFGDGGTGTGVTVEHAYLAVGTYEATLTVTDDAGLTGSATVTVIVEPADPLEVFADSFENGAWNGLWTQDEQNDWSITTKLATDRVASALVRGPSAEATLTSVPIDLAGRSTASITLSWQLRPRAAAGDVLALEHSADGGTTWSRLATVEAGVDGLGVWHTVEANVADVTTLEIRLVATIVGTRVSALVDDVVVTAGSVAPIEQAAVTGSPARNGKLRPT